MVGIMAITGHGQRAQDVSIRSEQNFYKADEGKYAT